MANLGAQPNGCVPSPCEHLAYTAGAPTVYGPMRRHPPQTDMHAVNREELFNRHMRRQLPSVPTTDIDLNNPFAAEAVAAAYAPTLIDLQSEP
jgi:hypothetical protein